MDPVITALRLVPKNALSRAGGALMRAPLPRPLARAAIGAFARAYRIDVAEAERDAGDYRTLTDFFTRRLKPGARPLPQEPDVVCSPCDGVIGQAGTIEDGTLLQAKGRGYPLRDFLTLPDDARDYDGGTYVTVYLAPHNYHRVHMPVSGRVTGFTHVPGHLWPVNARGLAEVDRLFAVNERLVTHLDSDAGRVAVTMVGATMVGRIRASYDDVVTNAARRRDLRRVRYGTPIEVSRGDECGVFELGSTVIVLFQKGRVRLLPECSAGAVVRLGTPLARIKAASAAA